MRSLRIVLTVTTNLKTDQRMHRICQSLHDHRHDILLVGRSQLGEASIPSRDYPTHRIPCKFKSGKLFYIEYNLKLLWFLLFKKADVICSIDLDTLLPGVIVSRLKAQKLVYDAHEYFTEMEEIVTRPFIHRMWKLMAAVCIPLCHKGYTISSGYAKLFKVQYNQRMDVIRNVPITPSVEVNPDSFDSSVIIYQGALNVGRGIEQAMDALAMLPDMELHLYGDGPERARFEAYAKNLAHGSRIVFHGPLAPMDLKAITPQAFAGLTLFSSTGIHHRLSLANRFFDYMHAGIPQLVMRYEEYVAIQEKYQLGCLINELSPEGIANCILKLKADRSAYEAMKAGALNARQDLCWEKESKSLIKIYEQL